MCSVVMRMGYGEGMFFLSPEFMAILIPRQDSDGSLNMYVILHNLNPRSLFTVMCPGLS